MTDCKCGRRQQSNGSVKRDDIDRDCPVHGRQRERDERLRRALDEAEAAGDAGLVARLRKELEKNSEL